MRLQLTAGAVALALATAAPALAQDAPEIERGDGVATSKLSLYQDDDATTVVTSLVDAQVGVADGTAVGAHVLVDSVSSASVDVVSAATPRFEEARVEVGARVETTLPRDLIAQAAFVRSEENDWQSHSLQLGLARDFAQKNTRVAGSIGLVGNRVGRSGDPTFEESASAQTYELTVTQLIDRRTLASATYTHQRNHGWQSSPYRFVTTTDGAISRLEHHPDQRIRHAVTLHGARYVWSDTALSVDYRLYRDDWGVLSHTVAGALHYAPGSSWDVRLRARFYEQGAAHFWRKRYDEPMTYMSADRELSTFWNLSGGVRVARRFGHLVADGKVDVIRYRFLELENLDGRLATVATAGVGYAW